MRPLTAPEPSAAFLARPWRTPPTPLHTQTGNAAAHLCAQVARAEDVGNLAGHEERLELRREVDRAVRDVQVG